MTTPLTASGTTPAPKNLVARFIGILTSPRDNVHECRGPSEMAGDAGGHDADVAIFTALPLTTDAGQRNDRSTDRR
jgi:hypothetical protein